MEVILEDSVAYESQTNGEIENAVGRIQGQFRSIKANAEDRYNHKIGRDHNIIPWMVRHSANIISRFGIRSDGKSPHEIIKGRKFKRAQCEIGESVWYLRPGSKGKDKFGTTYRWESGIWLGTREESGETIIGTKEGVIKIGKWRRKGSDEERWNWEELNAMRGIPWEVVPGKEGFQLKSRVNIPEEQPDIPKLEEGDIPEISRRRIYIQNKDVKDDPTP